MADEIKYNPKKLKSAVHYIISKCGLNSNVGRTGIYKLLYFSDFNFYELYETPITGESYIKKPNGPVPEHFIQVKEDLINEGKIKEEIKKAITYPQYRYASLIAPDITILDKKELEIIDDTINKLSDMSATEISNYSHGDLPWRIAENNAVLDYEYVFYRNPEYIVREYDE